MKHYYCHFYVGRRRVAPMEVLTGDNEQLIRERASAMLTVRASRDAVEVFEGGRQVFRIDRQQAQAA